MTKRIFIAGHKGMVGSAIARQLASEPDVKIITRSRSNLDLCNQQAVAEFFSCQNIAEIYLCAAKVGGIHANNTYPAEFIYPRLAEQPMCEDALLTGALEPTNEPYALAKIAGIKLRESYNRQYGTDYRSVMPNNQGLADLTARVVTGLQDVLAEVDR